MNLGRFGRILFRLVGCREKALNEVVDVGSGGRLGEMRVWRRSVNDEGMSSRMGGELRGRVR